MELETERALASALKPIAEGLGWTCGFGPPKELAKHIAVRVKTLEFERDQARVNAEKLVSAALADRDELRAALSAAEVARDAFQHERDELREERDQLRYEVDLRRSGPRPHGLEVVDSTPWVELRARQSGMNEPTQEPNPGADAPSPREHATGSVGEADVHDGNFAEAFEATNRSLAQLPCFCSLAARTPCAACTARAWLKPESPTPDNAALKQRVFSALGDYILRSCSPGYGTPDPALVQQFDMLGRDL